MEGGACGNGVLRPAEQVKEDQCGCTDAGGNRVIGCKGFDDFHWNWFAGLDVVSGAVVETADLQKEGAQLVGGCRVQFRVKSPPQFCEFRQIPNVAGDCTAGDGMVPCQRNGEVLKGLRPFQVGGVICWLLNEGWIPFTKAFEVSQFRGPFGVLASARPEEPRASAHFQVPAGAWITDISAWVELIQ